MGIDAAHVRWFAFDGPDTLDNGLALCVLHHKLFDLGVLGLDPKLRVQVSAALSARTPAGRAVYDLHGHGHSSVRGFLRQDGMRALALVSASMHEVSRRCSSVGRAAVL
jgi:hypothetical protein